MARSPSRKRSRNAPKEPSPRTEPRGAPRTLSGLPVDLVVGPKESARYLDDLGLPGEPPYTRGIRATMYRGRLWTMREYAGFGTAEQANRRFRYLLDQGNEGLSVAFDLPTQMGYDSDAPLARGEVGRVGVAISSLEDMRALLAGLPLERVSTSMTINATAPILLAMYVAVAEADGVPRRGLRGTVQNDILKEYIARSTYIYPPQPSMRLAIDLIEFCSREVPKWNAISVSGYHIREAGATAVQEIAFTLADAIAYLEAAVDRGLRVDDIAPQISFFFDVHMDFFEEIAKFRAARRLWARIAEERFHAQRPESRALRFHAQTAGVSLTAQQPENNAVRVTLQALAALLGGAQSLHTNSMDEALSLPSERAVRLAIRTQQILAHETGVGNTVDPVGGAYFVEDLTDRLESEARKLLAEIDRRGGMLKAVEAGWVQRQISESAYRQQLALEGGTRTVVGVNAFVEGVGEVRRYRLDPRIAEERARQMASFRKGRNAARARTSVKTIVEAAGSGDNLVPVIQAALKAGASLGEISDGLREVFGTYRPRGEV